SKTTSELRKALETISFKDNERYDREKHFDSECAGTIVKKFFIDFEDPEIRLQRQHLERWYCFRHYFLKIFSTLNFEVHRKNSTSTATSLRKNRKRARGSRKIMGVNDVEYGAIEVGKVFEGPKGTKLLDD
ncbi:10566_t:CDS:2, partial [Scutellospora calospora]